VLVTLNDILLQGRVSIIQETAHRYEPNVKSVCLLPFFFLFDELGGSSATAGSGRESWAHALVVVGGPVIALSDD
jgi:hypothetical protein